MKKALKVIGIILGVILVCVILLFEVSAFDHYIDSKIVKAKTPVVQAPPAGITIPIPEEFKDYFENVLAKDTINQIMISGQRLGNDTRKIKWAIVYNNYKPMK